MHSLVGGLRGPVGAAVFVVAIVASSFGTAWTAAPAFAANVDPLLRAGDLALVHTTAGTAGALSSKLTELGATEVATYTSVDMVVARVSAEALDALAHDRSVTFATADSVVVSLDRGSRTGYDSDPRDRTSTTDLSTSFPSLYSTGAPLAWSRTKGEGVTVGVMDTGVSKAPGLGQALTTQIDFVRDGRSGDPAGHGTFIAGVIAGSEPMAGVAPKAKILSLRVLDMNGNGMGSSLVAAFDWTLKHRSQLDVLNLSWGAAQTTSYNSDVLSALVEAVWFSGITVVAAAGNEGAVVTPGSDPFIVTAGAYSDGGTAATSDDTFASFSGQGPTLDGFAKPDVLAPGVSVKSLRVPGLRYFRSDGTEIGQVGDTFIRLTGTSVSTAFVSGAAALVLSGRHHFSPTKVKGALVASTRPIGGSAVGAMDAFRALTVAPAAVNVGLTPSVLLMQLLAAQLITIKNPNGSGSTWEGITWESITWESITWESVSWEGVTWEDAISQQVVRQ